MILKTPPQCSQVVLYHKRAKVNYFDFDPVLFGGWVQPLQLQSNIFTQYFYKSYEVSICVYEFRGVIVDITKYQMFVFI